MNLPLWVNAIGLLAVGAWVIAQVYPPTRAVRLRNSMLVHGATQDDFGWTPATIPAGFHQEQARPYDQFRDAVAQLDLNSRHSEWERALRIAEHLTLTTRDSGPIQRDLETTYLEIREGHGYCADFVRVFLGLSHAAKLCSRQWSFSFDGFGGHGHTFVEVFDRAACQWYFLDVHNNIHAVNATTGEPLGALAFRDALLRGTPEFRIVRNGAGRLGFPIEEKLLAYWRRGLHEWYLICGNAVFSYEARPLIRGLTRFSGPLGQMAASLLGEHPSIQVLVTTDNAQRVNALMALKYRFVGAIALCFVLAMLLLMQLFWQGKTSLIAVI